jgi:N-acyl-D-aspartate/D-glutamate deacylase
VNWNALAVHSANKDELERNAHKLGASDYASERGAVVIALTLSKTATMRLNMLSGFVFDLIPGWEAFFQFPFDERIKKLHDPAYRKELKGMAASMTGMLKEQFNWSKMKVTETFTPETKKYEGRVLGDIATAENRDPFDVFCDITIADGLRTRFMPGYPAESYEVFKERARLWSDPRTVVGGSDAGAHLDMIDTFLVPTTLLAYGVREQKVMSLEQGVHQLSEKPAKMMGLKNRGVLKQGWHADIVVFDADTVGPGNVVTRKDLPAGGERLYADANGIANVVVNGREIIRDNKYLGVSAGTVLRSGKDTYTVTIPAAKKAS